MIYKLRKAWPQDILEVIHRRCRTLGKWNCKKLERKVDRDQRKPLPKVFQEYSKRLLKDLEAKSNVRTAVEGLNLAIHGDVPDVLSAECIRTFPCVAFPAAELLRREEIETENRPGKSIIVAVHHARGEGLRGARRGNHPQARPGECQQGLSPG